MAEPGGHRVEGHWRGQPCAFRDNRLLISVRRGASISRTLRAVRTSLSGDLEDIRFIRPRGRRWAIVEFSPPADAGERIPALAERLAAMADLRYAEPDIAGSSHLAPNDPMYPDPQYWPQQVEMEGIWDRTAGADHVLIAIVDSGVCMSVWPLSTTEHIDLRPSRFITGHTIGSEVYTHNYTATPQLQPRDTRGHGTHVTGIAAATGNNGEGVAGANWKSPVYVARVIGDNSTDVSPSDVKLAVDDLIRYVLGPFWSLFLPFNIGWWFCRERVVINLSLGFQFNPPALREICEETAAGKVVMCVAAESRTESTTEIDYPAAFAADFPHVFAIGAVNSKDGIYLPNRTDYHAITLFAPGVDIPSTRPGYPTTMFPLGIYDAYAYRSGTSQACPIVAGAVSLLWSLRRRLRPQEIRDGLIDIAVQIAGPPGAKYPRLNMRDFDRIRPSHWAWVWWPW